jgi:hypothetical protein
MIILIYVKTSDAVTVNPKQDMAALAKTSKLAVLSQCFMVITVVVFSPWRSSINENGGLIHIVSNSVVNGSTVFIGLGVLGFAFVCQHSAFLNAGSLERPTKNGGRRSRRGRCCCAEYWRRRAGSWGTLPSWTTLRVSSVTYLLLPSQAFQNFVGDQTHAVFSTR